jgi:penicillin amidase
MPGDAATVRAAYSLKNSKTGAAASYRLIVDFGEPRRSAGVLPTGESGHFLSRHYLDQLPLWLDGASHPLLFEREEIEKAAESVLVLRPAAPRQPLTPKEKTDRP